VEVHAAGLNPIDIKLRKGEMKPILNYKLPLVLGTDLAGKVVELGSRVTGLKKGDEVYASLSTSVMGAFAEYVAVKADDLSLKPTNLSFEEAASLPLVGLTGYQALVDIAKLKPGQKVFVEAGSGGIGTFAIQLAKALGAEVATNTSTSNVAWVQKLGADHVIDYQKQKFEDVINNYDVVFHSVDREPTTRGFRVLKQGGHLLSIVGPPDFKFAQGRGLNMLMQIICGILGWKVTKLSKKNDVHYTFVFVEPSGKQLSEIKNLVESGKIKPVIDKVFPLEKIREAFAYLALGKTKGKVVLSMKQQYS
jgi:NADPH:quinone reductase-like Zn-dependent oxidoreductase